MTTMTTTPRPARTLDEILDANPVVVYDTMREAANRLISKHVVRGRRTGDWAAEAPIIRSIWDQADAVDVHDLDAQRALRAEFEHRRATFDD